MFIKLKETFILDSTVMDMSMGKITIDDLKQNFEVNLHSENQFPWKRAFLEKGLTLCPPLVVRLNPKNNLIIHMGFLIITIFGNTNISRAFVHTD